MSFSREVSLNFTFGINLCEAGIDLYYLPTSLQVRQYHKVKILLVAELLTVKRKVYEILNGYWES